MSHARPLRFAGLAAAIALAMTSNPASAAARIDATLQSQLAAALPLQQFEVVVTFAQSGPATASQVSALRALGIGRGISMRALPVVGAVAGANAINKLAQRSDVLSIVSDAPLTLYNADARRLSGVDTVQADPQLGYTGQGVAVLINDSGIDATHADLRLGERVIENVQGLTNLSSVFDFLPASYVEGQANTDVSSGHGTHCAGTVGGDGAQSGGQHRGVATGAALIGYGSGAVVSILDAVGGIDYAIANRDRFAAPIRVISNSWGSSGDFEPTDPVNVATYAAYKAGIVSVFAAGNDGPSADTHNPYAQAPWVISVGAGNKDGTLADFSSRGNAGESGQFQMPDGSQWQYFNQPTLVATGVDIVSTRAVSGALPLLASGQDLALGAQAAYYTHMSGTSMATPHVAGIVALMLEANPGLSPAEVRQILVESADLMPGRAAYEVGAGQVDALEATQLARDW